MDWKAEAAGSLSTRSASGTVAQLTKSKDARHAMETRAWQHGGVGDFMDDYPVGAGWDEMFDGSGNPRAPYKALYEVLQSLSADDFVSRCAARDHAFRDQGITFSHSGEE